MLADRGIVSPHDAGVLRAGARQRVAARRPVRVLRPAAARISSSSSSGCSRRPAARTVGRPSAHRPQPQRHRHDDVPDAPAGVRARALVGEPRTAPVAARAGRAASRHGVRGPHPHPARAADDGGALPARRDRTARTRRQPPPGAPTSRPTRARSAPARSRARGFPSIGSSRRRSSASPARRATPTAASPRPTICSRASPRPACSWPGLDASCRICCSGRRPSSTTCGWATASCNRAASCRRSGTRSRSSTRAPSAARRSARRRRSS